MFLIYPFNQKLCLKNEGRGSRIRIALKCRKAVFHRPHPHKETDKEAIKSVRRFLENLMKRVNQ